MFIVLSVLWLLIALTGFFLSIKGSVRLFVRLTTVLLLLGSNFILYLKTDFKARGVFINIVLVVSALFVLTSLYSIWKLLFRSGSKEVKRESAGPLQETVTYSPMSKDEALELGYGAAIFIFLFHIVFDIIYTIRYFII